MTALPALGLAALAALAASACAHRPAPALAPSLEVEAFMHAYTEAWNRHDHVAIARDFYRTGPPLEAQTASLAQTFEGLRAQGYVRSDIQEIRGCATGRDEAGLETAWAGMKFSRLTASGEPLPPRDRASAYDLKKFADGWRITRLSGHDASRPLACPG